MATMTRTGTSARTTVARSRRERQRDDGDEAERDNRPPETDLLLEQPFADAHRIPQVCHARAK